jgi:hypothetical protein
MEAVDDAAGALPADGPIGREPRLVKSRRHGVDVARVGNCAARRHEVLCAVMPNIGLRRSDLALVRGRLGAPRIHCDQTRPHSPSRVFQLNLVRLAAPASFLALIASDASCWRTTRRIDMPRAAWRKKPRNRAARSERSKEKASSLQACQEPDSQTRSGGANYASPEWFSGLSGDTRLKAGRPRSWPSFR